MSACYVFNSNINLTLVPFMPHVLVSEKPKSH